mmetsp:Transcript_93489/g.263653  ORF Transcript_93489/g.263653 Transcript_93489/m.263653 type:complete len:211 (+) Transcript_93489:547-1179(+)
MPRSLAINSTKAHLPTEPEADDIRNCWTAREEAEGPLPTRASCASLAAPLAADASAATAPGDAARRRPPLSMAALNIAVKPSGKRPASASGAATHPSRSRGGATLKHLSASTSASASPARARRAGRSALRCFSLPMSKMLVPSRGRSRPRLGGEMIGHPSAAACSARCEKSSPPAGVLERMTPPLSTRACAPKRASAISGKGVDKRERAP